MVAMFLTVIVSMTVYTLYDVSTGAFAAAEAELRVLQAFRSITNTMELELNSVCYKAGYTTGIGENVGPGEDTPAWAPPVFKAIDDGILPVRFENTYIGFYCSTDGRTIDRVEYYFNPPEPKIDRANGEDDDGDDPNVGADGCTPVDSGLPCLLIDDTGSFMLRRTLDCDPATWEYDAVDGDLNPVYLLFDSYAEPFAPLDFSVLGTKDDGDILADGFDDVRFWYVYAKRGDAALQVVSRWPCGSGPETGDETGYTYGGKGLSYLCLPQAVQVDFTFEARGFERELSKTIYLHTSLWNEFLDRAE